MNKLKGTYRQVIKFDDLDFGKVDLYSELSRARAYVPEADALVLEVGNWVSDGEIEPVLVNAEESYGS